MKQKPISHLIRQVKNEIGIVPMPSELTHLRPFLEGALACNATKCVEQLAHIPYKKDEDHYKCWVVGWALAEPIVLSKMKKLKREFPFLRRCS